MKSIFMLVLILLLSGTAAAQSSIAISFESTDASQFGYEGWDKGIRIIATHKLATRWEAIGAVGLSDAKKAYIGDGKHADGSLGARFYLGESVFLIAGGTIGRDWNSQYTKTAIRGFIGIGAKAFGFTGTVTAFSPPSDLAVDPNQVRGINILLEHVRPLFGPVGTYVSFQTSLASFNQTGGDLSMRFDGIVWKGRAGICLQF